MSYIYTWTVAWQAPLSRILEWVWLFGSVCQVLGCSMWGTLIFAVAGRIFSWSIWTLSCARWDLVHWPGIEPEPPALEAWSLNHWITREVPVINVCVYIYIYSTEKLKWKVELVLFRGNHEDFKPRRQHFRWPQENCFQGDGGGKEPGYIEVYSKGQVICVLKDYC